MPQAIVMPKLGNTVESAIILSWHVGVGDPVQMGEALCEIETDKATLEVESSASGILLARFFEAGDEVPVMQNIAVVGRAGESFDRLAPVPAAPAEHAAPRVSHDHSDEKPADKVLISPRARNLAGRKGIDYSETAGTGPAGRIIERDIRALIDRQVKMSPVAKAMFDSGEYQIADKGPIDKRITKSDLAPSMPGASPELKAMPLTGVRKTIAKRMLESMQRTAQLTLNTSADASSLRGFRARLKSSDEALGLRGVTINDLLLFAVARTLPAFPELNALYENDRILQHARVHLGMAVDTPRGLLVPVIRSAESLSLRALSCEAKRLAEACRSGDVMPDELAGGSFTATNLGRLGIESFTPILNPPQVGILGIGSINLKPVERAGAVAHVPHIGLSLTVNHQVVDGAPAARFLAQLRKNIASIELLLAL
ncbi:MAG: dihydrolipoamide acetyltransferase family protein [Chloroflexota bacterium]|nr:dihydrolipoamide acetyltransferase family protein [Chloroflexota bacterium]